MTGYNIASFNSRGLADKLKRRELITWLDQKNIKIALLQESHSTPSSENDWKTQWTGNIFMSHGNSNSRGTCILIHRCVPINVHKSIIDSNGRYVILDIDIDGVRMTVGSIYGPNEDNPEFFIDVIHQIESIPNDNRIIGGDFNLILDLNLDKKGGQKSTHKKSCTLVKNWMEETELVDIWRLQHPDSHMYTWNRKRPSPIFCRLDFFLVSYGITENIISSNISPGYRSDHSLVSINFIPIICERGRGFWKLNCSHLKDLEYIKLIKKTIESTVITNENTNANLLWDVVKTAVRGESIKYSSKVKKKTVNQIKELESQIQYLENQLITCSDSTLTNNNLVQNDIDTKKAELNLIIKQKTEGAIIRSRIQWYEEGETCSKYFFNLEKRTSNIKSINRLRLKNDIITTNPKNILREMKQFYENLYSANNLADHGNYFEKLEKPVNIPPIDLSKMEKEITEPEILKIVKSLPNNKTPGEDGLPSEFYKVFWLDIKDLLINCYRYSYETGQLSITQKRGLLCLTPKKSDPLYLKNWRPLSLLNQDYKILAKLVAERIKITLPYLINQDQTGFLKGRYIGHNIVTIFDIVHHTEAQDIPAILISIDFEKAFDKLEWSFISKCLDHFGFPYNIKKWFQILYTNIKNSVKNNGWHSDYFNLGRGVRQGCPLSPYLFILCAEILAMQIRANNNIKGIIAGTKEYKILQYADDTQLFTLFDKNSVDGILETLGEFSEVSGLKINFEKSEVLRIGKLRNKNSKIETHLALKWTKDPIKVLGIFITPNLTEAIEQNINPVIEKMSNIIKFWGHRKLTLFGKTTIIKSLLESQLIYRLSVLPSPKIEIMRKVDKMLFDYLWDNKPHKIKKEVVTMPKTLGGLAMVDINKKNTALKLSWVKRIIDGGGNKLYPILDKYLKYDIELLLKCNIAPQDCDQCWKNKAPAFWKEIFKHWCNYNHIKIDSVKEPRKEIILLNSNIKVGNKLFFLKELYEKNIMQFNDLLVKQENRIATFTEFQEKYQTRLSYLNYYSLIHAIPYKYKENLTYKEILNEELYPPKLKNIVKCPQKVVKYIYDTCISATKTFPVKPYQKWKSKLEIELSEDDFLNFFKIMYSCTRSTKLRDFQYRVLHSTLVTNDKLYKWGKINDESCSFCHNAPESITHLLVECATSKNLWNEVTEYIFSISGLRIVMTDVDKLMGIMGTGDSCLLNLIIIIVKQYIYACRCKNVSPIIEIIKMKINDVCNAEKSIAIKKNAVDQYLNKWQILNPTI